ncbi:acetamidase/formamidase family protein [Rossellomorea vietnamensis]|uniref:Acetamidase/formamidase family protein n=1 Tax=Rossellomorea vietnamensis TaxID=218284 RepID=A0A5D4KFD2_9BACI|nr:acetamidase/formamidase family protein [Rossellomorea vietnamensis]TYR75988.1 acetamidase/formamidase family protein [Rossellomorea vietnamensis]
MTTIQKENFFYSFSKENKISKKVSSGTTLIIETYDCFKDQITSEETELKKLDWNQVNPATGAVYVEGAEPGDILKVTIDNIELADNGVMMVEPGLGVMGHRIEESEVKMIPIEGKEAVFNDEIRIPLNPMIGVIGVAPEEGEISNGTPGAHGGNMDTKLIAEGSTLYLPVFQEGALFGLGDLHAAMGDGEISVSGIEIAGKVTVSLELVKGSSIPYPFVQNDEGLAVIVSKETVDEAAKSGVEIMIDTLLPQTDLTLSELTMLFSAAGQSQISQIVDPLMTARYFVPNYLLEKIGKPGFLVER